MEVKSSISKDRFCLAAGYNSARIYEGKDDCLIE